MSMLEVTNLGISFGGLRAVDNFNVNIEEGTITVHLLNGLRDINKK